MIKRLRRKFIVIVMALVGAVLVAVLGSSFAASYRAQNTLIENSLLRTLYGGMESRPLADSQAMGGEPPAHEGHWGGLMGVLVDVDTSGVVLRMSDTPVLVDQEVLEGVIAHVVSDGQTEGIDRGSHVAWTSIAAADDDAYDYDFDELFDDEYDDVDDESVVRIALVDISSSDEVLREQGVHNLQIVVVALVALFGITWWLSGWALRPVERAWEQQRRFVADASHELKTPLAVILANLQILQADESLSDDARSWVESSTDEAHRMQALVGDLLQLARADETAAGVAQGAMRQEDIDLSEMVESAALEFDAIAFERGCALEAHVSEGSHVTGDPEWLDRMVRILIDNACKYASEGSTVAVTLTHTGAHATLSVHNEGTPIAEEDLPHVFERFYRSDKARSREDKGGFGLGLAIAKGIVDAHGGKIAVVSSEEAGTTFTVTL